MWIRQDVGRTALSPALEENTVHIWKINLDPPSASSTSVWESNISKEERALAMKFVFERDRIRYVASHSALRDILGGYLGAPPNCIQFQIGDKGKPALNPSSGLYFNLAHSGQIALVAVTRSGEIGVDVEMIRPIASMRRLAQMCFAPCEFRCWDELCPPDCVPAFFNCWTRKESFIKAVGEGLSYPLDRFEVSLSPSETAKLISISGDEVEANRWTLQAIDLGPGYAAAFATQSTGVTIRYFSI